MNRGLWIGSPVSTNDHLLYHFRKTVTLKASETMSLRISADTRYKLYINGRYVQEGPCVGTLKYYDESDVSSYLTEGDNCFEVVVLYAGGGRGMSCLLRENRVSLWFDGTLSDGSKVVSDTSWEVAPDPSVRFYMSRFLHFNGYDNERHGAAAPLRWESAVFVAENYEYNDWGVLMKYQLHRPNTPMLRPSAAIPFAVSKTDLPSLSAGTVFEGVKAVKGEGHYVILELPRHFVGYPTFIFRGKGRVSLLYAESYTYYSAETRRYHKNVRNDTSLTVIGPADLIEVDGEKVFTPFLHRTARYIKVLLFPESELTVAEASFAEYRYPLSVVNDFACSDKQYEKIWEVSVNTLRNCLFDHYVDCPFYEMEQYIEDTYLEVLYTMMVSDDYEIVKKAITDIHRSLTPEGMVLASAPMKYEQITATFSYFYLMMIEKYLWYSGDRDFVRPLLPSILAVLDWFERYLNEDGVVGCTDYGKFIDWVKGWKSGFCYDEAATEPIVITSLMQLYCLRAAAEIFRSFGKEGTASDLEVQYDRLKKAVNAVYYDEAAGMYRDRVGGGFSEHSQIWAVLSGAAEGEKARRVMTCCDGEGVSRCSYSYRFFKYRAYEACGRSVPLDELLEPWKYMLTLGATTWFEVPGDTRSDCHGWSSVPLYELTTRVLGIRRTETGVTVAPEVGDLSYARGSFYTPEGIVHVSWTKENGTGELTVSSPEGLRKHIELPNGRTLDTEAALVKEAF